MRINLLLKLLPLILVITASCNRNSGNATITVDTLITDEAETEALFNSTSVDYEGIVPCADCPGINTLLHLNKDSMTYFLTEVYQGKADSVFTRSGTYRQLTGPDSISNIIELSGVKESGPIYYEMVGDTLIYYLDKDAKRIQSEQNTALRKKQ